MTNSVIKRQQYVLSKFDNNRFILNQSLIFPNTLLMPFVNSVGLWLVTIMLLSSANKTSLYTLDTVFGRSLMHRRKNEGPRIEP